VGPRSPAVDTAQVLAVGPGPRSRPDRSGRQLCTRALGAAERNHSHRRPVQHYLEEACHIVVARRSAGSSTRASPSATPAREGDLQAGAERGDSCQRPGISELVLLANPTRSRWATRPRCGPRWTAFPRPGPGAGGRPLTLARGSRQPAPLDGDGHPGPAPASGTWYVKFISMTHVTGGLISPVGDADPRCAGPAERRSSHARPDRALWRTAGARLRPGATIALEAPLRDTQRLKSACQPESGQRADRSQVRVTDFLRDPACTCMKQPAAAAGVQTAGAHLNPTAKQHGRLNLRAPSGRSRQYPGR
jgi:hypothetical protein